MPRIEKLIQRMVVNPRDVRFSEARRVLEFHGWVVDNIVGSHYTFLKGRMRLVLVRPHGGRKSLHPKDVKKVLEAIEST
ncbi:MAG: type II toxin-antitoxin system HicA family toxin [Deltaproteobacteria bacterium]|nr:type II toxin-antitoxin system HicA family toxin [Deltaproteobacteria bacterium]